MIISSFNVFEPLNRVNINKIHAVFDILRVCMSLMDNSKKFYRTAIDFFKFDNNL